MIHWLNNQYFFNQGSNYWQWITSIVALGGWGLYFHSRWHNRCAHCWRQGEVPMEGTVHKACKKHALEHGHTH